MMTSIRQKYLEYRVRYKCLTSGENGVSFSLSLEKLIETSRVSVKSNEYSVEGFDGLTWQPLNVKLNEIN